MIVSPQSNRLRAFASFAFIGFVATGCSSNINRPFLGNERQAPPPVLQPAPTQPVASTSLPPVTGDPNFAGGTGLQNAQPFGQPGTGGFSQDQDAQQLNAASQQNQQVAALSSSPTAGPSLSRDDLVGGWTVQSGAVTCQLFLSLTSWTGGYRASSRNCPDPQISSVQAWNVEGRQVTLKGEGGAEVARLYPTGEKRFAGALAQGGGVNFYR